MRRRSVRPRASALAGLLALSGCCFEIEGRSSTGPGAGTSGGDSDGGRHFLHDAGACVPAPPSSLGSTVRYTPSAGQWITSADLNGDGLLDLVAASSNGFEVLFGLPDGGLGPPISYARAATPQRAAIGDINGDGFPDVVLSYRGDNVDGYSFEIDLNDGQGGLALQSSVAGGPNLDWVFAIGDLNSDGRADLVVSEYTGSGDLGIAVLFGDGDGGFAPPVTIPGISLGWGSLAFALGDLNRDGLPDIVADTSDGSLLAVLINQGDGGFASTLYTTPAVGGILILPADGAPDLVLGAGGFVGNLREGVQLLRNRGDGTFTVGPSYAVPGGAVLAWGDFNGDCIPDIATSFGENCGDALNGLGVLLGDGDGGFSAPMTLQSPGEAPISLGALGPGARIARPRGYGCA